MFRTIFDKEKKQWNGLKTQSVFNPKSSLGNVILSVLQLNSSRVAQICAYTGDTITFDELYDQTICVANNLRKIGCKQGDVVFFYTDNSADIPAIAFAALCLGCTISSLATLNAKRENIHYLNIVKPKYVFCDLDQYDRLKNCFVDLNYQPQYFIFNGQTDDSRSIESLFEKGDSNSFFVPTEIDGTKEVAFISRSSGSTGMPKGILITHALILDSMRRLSSIFKASDVVLSFSRFFGVNRMSSLIGGTLNGSIQIVNYGTFSSERFFDLVERFKVTVAISSKVQIVHLLNHPRIETADLSSLKQYRSGGEKLSLDIIQKMNKYLKNGKLCQTYGMSEIGLITINLDKDRNDSVGQLKSGFEVKIVNERGERLGIDEEGEICVKQPYPFLGYLGGDENANNCFDNEGFFRTGDIGRFDENGDLFIVDRKKEMFKTAGCQVTPSEIEQFLNKLDGVKQSCSVPIPHPELSYISAVVIVKTKESKCSEQFIYDAVANNFANHKRLQGGIYFVDSLPMTATGKIARGEIRQMAFELYKSHKNEENTSMK